MEDELRKAVKDWVDYQIEKQAELEKIYPPNPPNEVCNNAYIKGLLIENSFKPQVGEINELFETEYEKLFVWTHDKNENSAIVIDVNLAVKDTPFWKNICSVMWMAMQYAHAFEGCRSVEGILGEPPNSKKQAAVFKHKEKWIELTGIDPDSIFEKANMSYLDFYYKLFFDLRNPSAHSYGNIHYKLEKSKTVQAQCFAAIIVRAYFSKHILDLDEAQKKLKFNMDLLDRVSENMSTKLTK